MVCWTKYQALLDIFYIGRVVSKTDVQLIFPPSQGILNFICSHWNSSHFYSCNIVGQYVWWLTTILPNSLSRHVRQNLKKSENFLSFRKLWTFLEIWWNWFANCCQLPSKNRKVCKEPFTLISCCFANDGEIFSIAYIDSLVLTYKREPPKISACATDKARYTNRL